MNLFKFLLCGLLVSSYVSADNNGVYYNELNNVHNVSNNHNNVNFLQKMCRTIFLGNDVIIVSSDCMPQLYSYIQDICQQEDMNMPAIFVTKRDSCLSTFFQKHCARTNVVIGNRLLQNLSDDEVEAVVLHQLGHIKYKHFNKIFIIFILLFIITSLLFIFKIPKPDLKNVKEAEKYGMTIAFIIMSSIIIIWTKWESFERETAQFELHHMLKKAITSKINLFKSQNN